ncbi:MAG: YraN family protein [Chloroflexi bacterium]|nr:YraN family protein [Chloroflexota bacterium]
MTSRKDLGDFGERVAKAHLESKGYRILATNFRVREGEVDIVAERDGVVAFVEVKTRRSGGPGTGEDAVDARKRLRLVRGAAAWMHEQPRGIRRARFDVIVCECSRDERDWRLRHLEGAFDANV